MALILSKSPYHISRRDLEPDAVLVVEVGVWEFSYSGTPSFNILESYEYNFRKKTFIDIAPVVHDTQDELFTFLPLDSTFFKQDFSNNNLIVKTSLSGQRLNGAVLENVTYDDINPALRGYAYSTDAMNYDATEDLAKNSYYAGSSDIVYKLDDSNLELPIVNPTNSDNSYENLNFDTYVIVTAFNKGEIIDQQYLYFNANAVYQKYTTNHFASFTERVEDESGTIEQTQCLTDFFDCHKLVDIDKVTVSSSDGTPVKIIEVRTIEEKKHNPYRLSFKNRFGVWENLWFFKKSTEVLKVESSSFRANQFKQRNAGNGIAGEDNLVRSTKVYNKNGLTELTLNSGFVDEALNESFKQLMLSDEVVLYNFKEGTHKAVTVANTDLQFKTSTNDKLINYEITVKSANNIIDDIV